MACFLVLSKNSADPEIAANDEVSSENPLYPLSNAYNINKRRKTWRTRGHWSIIAGDNTIVFQETVGINLTATIAVAEYTSDTAFFAALKAALEAAGTSTYTISRDITTNKIIITAVLGGGATVFRLIWTNAGSTDMAGILGYDTSSDDIGSLSYTADLVRIHTGEWIEWDLGFPLNPTAFVVAADRNKPLKFSPSALIKIQANSTNSWGTPALDLVCSYEDFVLGAINQDGLASQAYRYWRFYVEDKDNPYGYIEAGAVFLGVHVAITRGAPVFPLEPSEIDLSPVAYSEGGQTIAGEAPKTRSFGINWQGLDKQSFENLMEVFQDHGKHDSFLLVMDAEATFSTDPIRSAHFVKFNDDPSERLVSPGNWSMGWSVREEL